jgi:hypothetical protein
VLAACAPASAPATSDDPPAPTPASSALASASPKPASSNGSAAIDACGLLTEAEIMDVTGYAVESMQPAGGFTPTGCQWDLDEGDPDLTARLLLNVQSTGGRAQYDSYAASLFSPAPVAGLGDEAVDDGGFVLAVQGDVVVGLGYPGFAFEDGWAAALVEIVLGRV